MNRRARPGLFGFFLGCALIWAFFVPLYSERGLTIDPRPPVVLLLVLLLLAFIGADALDTAALAARIARGGGRAARAAAACRGGEWSISSIARSISISIFATCRICSALYVDAAGWRGILVLIAATLGTLLLLWLTVRALAAIERAMARPVAVVASLAAGLIGLLLIALPFARPIDTAAASAAGDQTIAAWRAFTVLHGFDRRYAAALDKPQPPTGKLPGLKGKDVYLVFVESLWHGGAR